MSSRRRQVFRTHHVASICDGSVQLPRATERELEFHKTEVLNAPHKSLQLAFHTHVEALVVP